MAKINTYPNDNSLNGADKLIGTDSSDNSTKNFTITDLASYIAEEVPAKTLAEVTAAGNTTSGDIIVQGEMQSDSILNEGNLVTQTIQSNGACTVYSLSSANNVSGTTGTFTGLLSTTGSIRFTNTMNIGGGNSKFTFDGNSVEQGGFTFNGRTQIKTELVNISSVKSYYGQNAATTAGLVKGDIYFNLDNQALSIVL